MHPDDKVWTETGDDDQAANVDMDPQYFHSSGGAGIYYTITEKQGIFQHHISLKLKKYAWHRQGAVQFSLIMMLELTRQF